ncbi:UNVERIFIED_CONTAM: hypothetical protein K2H54_018105 [Gekko kuhli]
MEYDGGGWTVLHRNDVSQKAPWTSTWNAYKMGFGDLSGNHWLGNEFIHLLTQQNAFSVRFLLVDSDGKTKHADYHSFKVDSEDSGYVLRLGNYSGDAGDALTTMGEIGAGSAVTLHGRRTANRDQPAHKHTEDDSQQHKGLPKGVDCLSHPKDLQTSQAFEVKVLPRLPTGLVKVGLRPTAYQRWKNWVLHLTERQLEAQSQLADPRIPKAKSSSVAMRDPTYH